VTVLYLAGNPRSQAIIDRGFLELGDTAILFIAAAIMALISFAMLRSRTGLKTATAS